MVYLAQLLGMLSFLRLPTRIVNTIYVGTAGPGASRLSDSQATLWFIHLAQSQRSHLLSLPLYRRFSKKARAYTFSSEVAR
ncbi:hypothetical protein B0H15DRAFT_844268 [Mycena belliarum]|uniref:Uncharacterized protein n=1 Tax=Mycena belliarum TaxID=1033014 RepID=A0AAD6U6B7_9AGAR|nr:hypothetical protein B0H15DRAFT_844268 [Mycena belliae]